MRTLGTGTFGRVTLVQHKPSGGVYALKAMQKQQIMQSKQERNIMNEKNLLYVCAHPFVLALIECYQDTDSIYMLMEIVQGGELWCYIYERFDVTRPFRDAALGGFTGPAAAFYAGCVIAAFAHVHAQGIAYRDLKPENLLIDVKGYCKVIDFGFAKKIPGPKGDLSYTICGTPEYLAPEILNSKGHDKAVDVWALGCLVYELLVGRTPFADDNQSRIFQRVLGADKFLATPAVWPRGFDPDAKDLIKQMLATSPARRLGYGTQGPLAIKDHAWFKKLADDKAGGFDWEKLVTKTLPAPFVPGIKDRSTRRTSTRTTRTTRCRASPGCRRRTRSGRPSSSRSRRPCAPRPRAAATAPHARGAQRGKSALPCVARSRACLGGGWLWCRATGAAQGLVVSVGWRSATNFSWSRRKRRTAPSMSRTIVPRTRIYNQGRDLHPRHHGGELCLSYSRHGRTNTRRTQIRRATYVTRRDTAPDVYLRKTSGW